MKNSAYLFANSILSVVDGIGGGGEETGPTGFVSRGGDSMKGALSAWYGFDAGVNGQKYLRYQLILRKINGLLFMEVLMSKGMSILLGS